MADIQELGRDLALLRDFAAMLQEMQAHYDVPCPSADDILRGLIERPKGAEIIVAMEASTLAGFAAFSAIYPGPYLQAGLFLKELYVRSAYRGRGIGQEMLAHLARLAGDRGLSRIDWTADAKDERLLRFYDSIGGQQKPDKIFYRLDGDALKRLAS
ncbi:GNAT family N-acetyltransferase [Neorhizobium galegae]|uniref:GNAT family N-acetyltransferase n=1 Tax=Neorhizobium galegae TaxID=399 RepID=UPI0006221FCD|nr:GNAT family N-acetyltransferase [Neorhizobium galegae]CDZ29749.1 Putative acetyltransferase protein [Neorhizobium galegae bv. officinalis]KAA9383774.1 GNAT family N-acetyltransferase [Neorhizobium galegae]MCM2500525.1 GNAT family N-acetyltransferase [Neorhizobium galegae]MCQ1768186.1 GNAT family N-acetyltransferase [Neorhizobium galegae]MCQ1770005.1 GNAT family N-acetyltransferase [Neorhizobium galegae]